MDRFFSLLRKGDQFKVVYDHYEEGWSDEELCKHIVVLRCAGFGLTHIPPLPNAERVDCHDNALTEIPDLPKCLVLSAGGNKLRKIHALPLVEVLLCYNNELEDLPVNMPNLTALSCRNNKLMRLECDSKLKWLDGRNNPWKYHMKIPSHPRIMCRGMIFTHISIDGKAMK